LISKLAKIINSMPVIKKIWGQEFTDCYTIYHKILSNNYHSFNCEGLTGTPVLTPRFGFKLTSPEVEINERELIFKCAPISNYSGINASLEKFITVVSIFMIKSPSYSEYDPYISFRIGIKEPLVLGNPVQLTTQLNQGCCLLREIETLYKSWSVLITLDEKDNPVHYSEIISWSNDSIEIKSEMTKDHQIL
jgi:hypothetical protein